MFLLGHFGKRSFWINLYAIWLINSKLQNYIEAWLLALQAKMLFSNPMTSNECFWLCMNSIQIEFYAPFIHPPLLLISYLFFTPRVSHAMYSSKKCTSHRMQWRRAISTSFSHSRWSISLDHQYAGVLRAHVKSPFWRWQSSWWINFFLKITLVMHVLLEVHVYFWLDTSI